MSRSGFSRVAQGFAALLLLGSTAACHRAPEPPAPLSPGVFRMVLETPGGDLPFDLPCHLQEDRQLGAVVEGPGDDLDRVGVQDRAELDLVEAEAVHQLRRLCGPAHSGRWRS